MTDMNSVSDFDLSVWNKIRTESIFSLVTCVLGLVCLVMSVTKYFRTRQLVPLVFGSFGFVSSGNGNFCMYTDFYNGSNHTLSS